jgi:hypothetical protein
MTAKTSQQQVSPVEKILIQILTSTKEDAAIRSQITDALESEHLHHGWPTEGIFEALLKAPENSDAGSDAQSDPMQLPLDDADRNRLAAILMESPADPDYTAASVRVALAALRRPHIERALQQLQPQIDDAAKKGDAYKLTQLSAEKMKLKRALDESMRAGM